MHALRKTESSVEHVDSITPTIVQLSKLSFVKGLRSLAFDWIVIFTAISLSIHFTSLWIYLAAILVIAARQHALLMLTHEGAHFRMAKSHALNNAISDTFAAFPVFFCTTAYRNNHLKHHRYLNSMQDPDWARKIALPEWSFPQTRTQLWKTLFQVFATGWYKMILLFLAFSGITAKSTYSSKPALQLFLKKLVFYSVAAVTIYKLNIGFQFLLYWVVPFLFVLPVLERIRSISEHFALNYKDDLNQTRDILCTPLEAFLFGPHNIRYHLCHHLYPSVPQYNLPQLHKKLLQQPGFAETAHQNDAYFLFGKKSVLQDLVQKSETFHEQ